MKYLLNQILGPFVHVAPIRGRGLKYFLSSNPLVFASRPHTGAWIEMWVSPGETVPEPVAPIRGRGLKFFFCSGSIKNRLSPPYGGVGWNGESGMNMNVIDCNVLHFKDNWVCPTRRLGRVCLRRTPTALGPDVVCSTNWTGLSLTRRRKSLLSSVRRRRRRGFPAFVFCVRRQMHSIWHPLA